MRRIIYVVIKILEYFCYTKQHEGEGRYTNKAKEQQNLVHQK